MTKYDVLIVGGGLTGLSAATCLVDAGLEVKIIEAGEQIGGRIKSLVDPVSGATLGDLGPTWVWPAAQTLVVDWLHRLGLEMFPQFETGDAIIEQSQNSAPVRYRLPGMQDGYRIAGGTTAITDRLANGLPPDSIMTGVRVTSISSTGDGVEVLTNFAEHASIRGRHVIVCVPLRIAADTIKWSPALPLQLKNTMAQTPTWMAPQAKVVAVYDAPFWREMGLSGRLASHIGPLAEAHDHSGVDGTPAALFGFIGRPHETRRSVENLGDQILEQLERCFGPKARNPRHFEIEDWANNPLICSSLDLVGPAEHPGPVNAIVRSAFGDNRIHFAVAETATQSPGLIEGAFAAGEGVAEVVLKRMQN